MTVLRDHKTKIVATIGPASDSPEMIERLIRAGLDIARLNFSHGDFSHHGEVIARIRVVAEKVGRMVAIMADLPGPKMRLGKIDPEPIQLQVGDQFTLTSEDVVGNNHRASMSFEALPSVLKVGNRLFLNDGMVQLQVEGVDGNEVHCRVTVGGKLSSRKGLNLPGIKLGISAFTEHDRRCLEFALAHGVDAVSQSFVERAQDVELVRAAALGLGKRPFVIAKIERSDALAHYDEIMHASDGIMVARGDLGVEVPVEEIAVLQKELIAKANIAGKPIITATQMLAKIAAVTEPRRSPAWLKQMPGDAQKPTTAAQAMGLVVEHALEAAPCAAVFVPTRGGDTARMIARFKPQVWVVAVGNDNPVMKGLLFSYGVESVHVTVEPDNWRAFVNGWLRDHHLPGNIAFLVAAASSSQPDASHRIEFMRIGEAATSPASAAPAASF
jgi:pyruvate kinase